MNTTEATFQQLLHCANNGLCHQDEPNERSQQQAHKSDVYCDGEEAGLAYGGDGAQGHC